MNKKLWPALVGLLVFCSIIAVAFTANASCQGFRTIESKNSTQLLYQAPKSVALDCLDTKHCQALYQGPISTRAYSTPVPVPVSAYSGADINGALESDVPVQSSPTPTAPVTPVSAPLQVILFSGVTYNGGGNPRAGMNIGALYQFTPMIYGGLVADVGFNKSPQTNVRGEMAIKVADVNGIPIFTLVDVGGSFAASNPSALLSGSGSALAAVVSNVGTNIGYSAASGLATAFPFPLYKKLYMMPSVRAVKGSLNDMQYVIAINFGAPVKIKKE